MVFEGLLLTTLGASWHEEKGGVKKLVLDYARDQVLRCAKSGFMYISPRQASV